MTGVTEQVSETEEAKELFVPKESEGTAAIGDEIESSYAVVIDEQDGTVVAGKNAHEKNVSGFHDKGYDSACSSRAG